MPSPLTLAPAVGTNAKHYVVITGELSVPRKLVKKCLADAGLRVGAHIRKGAIALIAGQDMLAKPDAAAVSRAKKVGCPVLDEDTFSALAIQEGVLEVPVSQFFTANELPAEWSTVADEFITQRSQQRLLIPSIRNYELGDSIDSVTKELISNTYDLCKQLAAHFEASHFWEKERIGRWVMMNNVALGGPDVDIFTDVLAPARLYQPGVAGNLTMMIKVAEDDLFNFSQDRVAAGIQRLIGLKRTSKMNKVEAFLADNHGCAPMAMRRRFLEFLFFDGSTEANDDDLDAVFVDGGGVEDDWMRRSEFVEALYWLAPFGVIDTSVDAHLFRWG